MTPAFFYTKVPDVSSSHLEIETLHRKLLILGKYAGVATLPSPSQVVITWLHVCICSLGSGDGLHGPPLLSPKAAEVPYLLDKRLVAVFVRQGLPVSTVDPTPPVPT